MRDRRVLLKGANQLIIVESTGWTVTWTSEEKTSDRSHTIYLAFMQTSYWFNYLRWLQVLVESYKSVCSSSCNNWIRQSSKAELLLTRSCSVWHLRFQSQTQLSGWNTTQQGFGLGRGKTPDFQNIVFAEGVKLRTVHLTTQLQESVAVSGITHDVFKWAEVFLLLVFKLHFYISRVEGVGEHFDSALWLGSS